MVIVFTSVTLSFSASSVTLALKLYSPSGRLATEPLLTDFHVSPSSEEYSNSTTLPASLPWTAKSNALSLVIPSS